MNPFKPTAGKNPPELIGRAYVIDQFVEGIENGPGAPDRLLRIDGTRGTGKTVMLNEIARAAAESGWDVVDETANEGFCARIVKRLTSRSRVAGASVAPQALGVGLGSLDVERASLSLREAIARHASAKRGGLLVTLDEVQGECLDEMRALAVAVQHAIRDGLDIAFVFAGLPSMVGDVVNGDMMTFLRRATPVHLGFLDTNEVALSFVDTVRASGLGISDELAARMAELTRGYPFLVQLVGYHVWQAAYRRGGASATVESADVERGFAAARGRFDGTVVEPALHRMPAAQLAYLEAMAVDGAVSSTAEVAARLGKTTQSTSPVRAVLIREGLIESPRRGEVAFAVPFMDEYLRTHADELASL